MADDADQGGPECNPVRRVRVTAVNNRPQVTRVRTAIILFNGVTVANGGVCFFNLGGVAIPQFLPSQGGAGYTGNLVIYRGDMALEITEFSGSQPLASGTVSLLTVDY